jgi:hypothetical protein
MYHYKNNYNNIVKERRQQEQNKKKCWATGVRVLPTDCQQIQTQIIFTAFLTNFQHAFYIIIEL